MLVRTNLFADSGTGSHAEERIVSMFAVACNAPPPDGGGGFHLFLGDTYLTSL